MTSDEDEKQPSSPLPDEKEGRNFEEEVDDTGNIFREAERELCKEAFSKFDPSGSGIIPKEELTPLLRCMGQNPTDNEVNDMINKVDVDGSGVVEFEEFVTFFNILMKSVNPENEAREAYRRFDQDSEGNVDLEDLRFVLSNLPVRLSNAEIEEMVKSADPDNDGKLSFQEFRVILGL
ncbi:neo-calmodulin [Lepeophtheirus salmonis]|uniref:neo-calmodulin n=1 Tax=Lepeophtheirus salmonis TaxID=72036 RepID=UPI001AEAF81C|nr:neo-calmodulin-like [Lepeophtheirus salmonis]